MGDLHELLPLLLKGTLVTVEIAVSGILLAIVMAGMATVLRSSAWRVLRWTANAYVEVCRYWYSYSGFSLCCRCRLSIWN
jgi:polar amino acid transport system permease protein